MVKLSLIVPVYNVGEYLGECLKSIVNQNYGDYEVIVVNDGSTDNSLEIAKNYEKKYSNIIKVYDNKNAGVSAARNFGIKKAKGNYLFFIDSDDCIMPNCLSIIDKKLMDSDILVFNALSGKSFSEASEISLYDNEIEDIDKRYIIAKPCVWNKVFKKELFNDVKFPDGLYYEDLALIPKLVDKGRTIKFIDDCLYFYRVRNSSIMNQKKYNPKMDSIFEVLDQLKEYFDGDYNDEIEYLYIEHLLRGASLRYFDCGGCSNQLDKIVSIIKSEFPNWKKNKYVKTEGLKKKLMCWLFYSKWYTLIKLLRK